jgi:hypothetical protein
MTLDVMTTGAPRMLASTSTRCRPPTASTAVIRTIVSSTGSMKRQSSDSSMKGAITMSVTSAPRNHATE